jgi:protease-4
LTGEIQLDQNNDHTYPDVPENNPNPGKTPSAAPPQAIPVYMPPAPAAAKARPSILARMARSFFVMIFITSLIINFYLGLFLFKKGLHEKEYLPGNEKTKIALIDLEGSINMDTQAQLHDQLRHAARDNTVKTVILVVNSPGGQVAPSNMMNRYIKDFIAETGKKIYVSIQQVGASGAYWAAAATNKIYAQPNSMVGSIGVIYVNMVLKDALEQKLGISPVVVKSSRAAFKDRGSPFRYPTEEDLSEIQKDLDKIHQQFVSIVKDGRQLTEENAWALANGDVYDGEEALEKGLIDGIGFLDDVIDVVCEDLSLENPQVVHYYKPPTFKEMIFAGSSKLQAGLDLQQQLENWAMTPRIQAIWLGQ